MIHLSPLALAGALIATSVSVMAASPTEAATRHIAYSDLDLNSAAGRAALDHRIGKAAASVCAAENRELAFVNACRHGSIDQAHSDLERAMRARQVQMASR